MNSFRLRQAWTIAKFELRRAFFSKRAFWVYLLALFPAIIFFGHALEVKISEQRWSRGGKVSAEAIDAIKKGMTDEEVRKAAGRPQVDTAWRYHRSSVRETEGGGRIREYVPVEGRRMLYFDGRRRADLWFEAGVLREVTTRNVRNFEEDRLIFAGVFQYFYLRLAIFFGCLGIFMNLFRGEMLDKTLHFWFLAPARREVLLAGKYLAGLIASTVIFTAGAALCFGLMLWLHDPADVQAYWQGPGLEQALLYLAAAAFGCVGYGSVFLAAGLLLRNPIIPAAVLLVWEGINGFLPDILQKFSVLYYLQSLCPVPAPMDSSAPALVRLLLSPAAPASRLTAVADLLAVTALVLWTASYAVRRIEINYGTE